jgi:signal transduction histidine kinase
VVDRTFHELAAMPRVLAKSGELNALVSRYNAMGEVFARTNPEERAAQLKNDPAVAFVNQRLTAIRNDLKYDLLYVLDARGIRIMSSDWDRPVTLLGVRLDDREYFREAMADRAGQMFAVGRSTRNPVMFFSAPIDGAQGSIGVVVVRQDSDAIGATLRGSRHVTFIVDDAGMVVASSRNEYTLVHVGALTDRRPDATTLRTVYAQDALRTLDVRRPSHAIHDDEWVLAGHPYLLKRASLQTPGYSLLVLSPIERLEAIRPVHYAIGVMAALFGVLIALLAARRAESLAMRRHNLRTTAALNDKLKALNTDKDRYLGIAAHDLRNPLSSMRGLAGLMLETPLEPEQQREFLETIHRTSDELLALVNDLLDISVIESGKLDLKRADADVSKLVRQRLRHLEPYARSKQIDVRVEAAAGQHATIDGARFAQVIDNLVSNAIKFSPSGTAVDVALRPNGGGFTFGVQDQGPGIPEHDKKLLFRSFQKLSARPTGGEKSTGLGLAIVKKIIDAHGGEIEVDDAEGGGTRFTVTMPSR